MEMFIILHGKFELPAECPCGVCRELFGRSPGAQERKLGGTCLF